ncbi:MAG TPA: tetratricopeptide repeat protein [Firmicutes bacterium]|nr:tetratricopeptide repeat protein [Bacillota bacterium]
MFTGFNKKSKSRLLKGIIIFVAVTFALGLAYTGTRIGKPASTDESRPIAVVNGEKITFGAFAEAHQRVLLNQHQQMGDIPPELYGPLRVAVLDQMVQQTLLLQEAKKERIKVSSRELNEKLNQQKAGFSSDKEFKDALEYAGLTVPKLRELLRQQLLLQNLIDKVKAEAKVSPEDVKKAYQEEYKKAPEGPDFEKARPELEKRLKAEAEAKVVDKWFKGVMDSAKIDIFDDEINGIKSAQKGDLDKAITYYESALKRNPDNQYVYVDLGIAYQRKKDIDKAIANFKKAVELSPNDAYMRLLLGNAYKEKGMVDEAVTEFRQASDLGYADMLLHFRLQGLFKAMGKDADARNEEKRIQELQKLMEARQKAQQQQLEQQLKKLQENQQSQKKQQSQEKQQDQQKRQNQQKP